LKSQVGCSVLNGQERRGTLRGSEHTRIAAADWTQTQTQFKTRLAPKSAPNFCRWA